MRKRYNVSLDQEKTEYIKAALSKTGVSFSSFLDLAVDEFYDNLKAIKSEVPEGKKELSGVEFLEALTKMWRKMEARKK